VLNNMGVAFAHMGVLAQGRVGGALNTWATPFSLERQTAIKYKGIDPKGASRGGDNDVPWQLVQAVELFKEAVSKDPGYRRAALNLATAQIATGATSDALAGLAKLSGGTGSEAAEVQNLVGVANAVAGKNKEAESAFKDAIKADGTQQAAMFNLGHFYQVTSRKSDADAAYKSFLAKYPSGPWSDAAKKEMGPAK
jgi:tetratricopeptide (TPR) repeat protein